MKQPTRWHGLEWRRLNRDITLPRQPIEKPCPVVTLLHQCQCEILAFAHPQAGHQFVKGTIKTGESEAAAARHELCGQAGLTEVKTAIVQGQ